MFLCGHDVVLLLGGGGGGNHIFFQFYHFTASLISTQSVKHFLFLMSVNAPTPR